MSLYSGVVWLWVRSRPSVCLHACVYGRFFSKVRTYVHGQSCMTTLSLNRAWNLLLYPSGYCGAEERQRCQSSAQGSASTDTILFCLSWWALWYYARAGMHLYCITAVAAEGTVLITGYVHTYFVAVLSLPCFGILTVHVYLKFCEFYEQVTFIRVHTYICTYYVYSGVQNDTANKRAYSVIKIWTSIPIYNMSFVKLLSCVKLTYDMTLPLLYVRTYVGHFPTDDGLVAPGMSCSYTVRFTPDSLADFQDELKVGFLTSEWCQQWEWTSSSTCPFALQLSSVRTTCSNSTVHLCLHTLRRTRVMRWIICHHWVLYHIFVFSQARYCWVSVTSESVETVWSLWALSLYITVCTRTYVRVLQQMYHNVTLLYFLPQRISMYVRVCSSVCSHREPNAVVCMGSMCTYIHVCTCKCDSYLCTYVRTYIMCSFSSILSFSPVSATHWRQPCGPSEGTEASTRLDTSVVLVFWSVCCVRVHMHVCAYVCVCVCVCMHCVCVYAMHGCVLVSFVLWPYRQTCTCTHTYLCTYMCMYVHTVRMYVCKYIHVQ